jgi:hypothetical protein
MTFQAAKQGFFDRAKVKKAVDAGTWRVLSKFGAYVRRKAKKSIHKRKGASPPGRPPHSHVGLLRKLILFAYDPQRKSVVIGPTLIRAGSEAPRLLEHGGETIRRTKTKTRRLRYRPRPFMGPAFVVVLKQLEPLWKGSIR